MALSYSHTRRVCPHRYKEYLILCLCLSRPRRLQEHEDEVYRHDQERQQTLQQPNLMPN